MVYEAAFHRHANTETIVGHTTLATGADPSTHGMVANVWLDRETGKLPYNIQDPRYPLLTKGAGVDKASEVDPTQRAASTDGRSPASILVSTLAMNWPYPTRENRRSSAFPSRIAARSRWQVTQGKHFGSPRRMASSLPARTTTRIIHRGRRIGMRKTDCI